MRSIGTEMLYYYLKQKNRESKLDKILWLE